VRLYVIDTINMEIRKTETANQCVDVDGWVTGRRKNMHMCTRVRRHTHKSVLHPFFLGLPGWAGARRNLLLDFIVQGKITEADTLTIQMDATPSSLIPHFYAGCPSCRNPPNLSWLGTGTKYAGLHTQRLG